MVADAAAAPDGAIVIATNSSSLVVLRDGAWTTCRLPMITQESVTSLCVTDGGLLATVFASGRLAVCDLASTEWEQFSTERAELGSSVNALVDSARGGMWVATDRGIARLVHERAHGRIADADEAPGLHEADRRRQVGGFDERLSTSADWDLCYRLARRRPVGFVAQPLVRYRVRRNAMHFDVALMEKDMLLAYAKAFQERSPELQRRRGRSYAALHMVLAGSFLAKGLYGRGALHALRGLAQHPSAALRVLAYPGRAWSRRRAAQRAK